MSQHHATIPAVWLLSLALLAITLIAAGTFYVLVQSNETVSEVAAENQDCDLQKGPCIVSFDDGGSVELTVSPRPIRTAVPLVLGVKTLGIDASHVHVDFSGEGMRMGYNRPELIRSTHTNAFTGEGVLSICTLDRMYWRATVLLETDRGVLAAPYRFETSRN